MKSALHAPSRVPRYLRAALIALPLLMGVPAQADVTGGEKPGFLGRLFGGDTPPSPPPPAPAPATAATAPAPKPKPQSKPPSSASSSSNPKREKITIRPGGGTSSSKVSTGTSPAKPSLPKPASKPSAPPEVKPAEIAKAPAPQSASEGEFGDDKDDSQPTSNPTEPLSGGEVNSKLPANAGWQIVKINGRDYITGESLHQFYRFSSYKVEGKHVWLRSNNLILKGTLGSQELLINNIKFILSYPLIESGGRALFSRLDLCKLIDPVLRPTYITDAEPFDTVVIDAGHGGHDAGARGVYGYEKDFALKMAMSLREALTRKGFKVVMTRSTDTFITLSGRVAKANATPNSIFVSLHFNSGASTVASGIETFALTPQGSSASLERGGGYNANGLTGNAHDSANIALATAVHAMVISKFKFVDRGIKRAQWSVLTGCKRPGILFEGGFVTNTSECRLIASDTYRQAVSGAMADAIVNYRTALRGAMTRRQ